MVSICSIRNSWQIVCVEVKRFVNNPDTFFRVSLSVLLIALLFINVEIKIETYALIVALSTLVLWSRFSFGKNIRLYLYYAGILVISEVALYVQKGCCIPFWCATVMFLAVYCLLFLLWRHLHGIKRGLRINEDVRFDNLFRERKQDLERLMRYLDDFKILGLNSFWGNGKTYLYEMLRMQNEESFYYISISVMTLQIDSVEKFLVSEISRVLEQHKIYSAASAKLSLFLNQDSILYGTGYFFTANSSYTESFQTLMTDINKLDRPLLITFEDIDRSSSRNIAEKVFAISEMLTRWTARVRILFQYDRSRLCKLFEGEPESYIEKYIPYTIDLTPISFGRCVKVLLTNGHSHRVYSHLDVNDFHIVTSEAYIGSWFENAGIKGIGSVITLTPKWYSIRSVELFIKEVEALMAEDASYDKNVVVLLLFAKHFLTSEIFNVNLSEGIYDNPIFSFEGESCNIKRILAELIRVENVEQRRQLYAKIFPAESKNLYYLLLMNKLGYKLLPIEETAKTSDIKERLSGIANERIIDIKEKDSNEKIDRLVRHMYACGRSDRTNLENAVVELEKVLDLENDERGAAFKQFLDKAYYQDFEKVDNETIFILGVPQFLAIFKSFMLYERNSTYWLKLLDLYFSYHAITEITSDLLQCLNYCDIEHRDVFMDVVRRFNDLKIIGNLNGTKTYARFLRKYVTRTISLTGIRAYYWRGVMANESVGAEIVEQYKNCVISIKSELNKLRSAVVLGVIKDDCDVMLSFLNKNNQLVQSTRIQKEFNENISIHTEILNPVQNVEQQIKRDGLACDHLDNFLADNYMNGNLNATDVQRLRMKFSSEALEKGDFTDD